MTGDRLTGSDKRALLLWVVAGVAGALFASKYYFRAFPEASVNFQISREDALARAQKFVTGLGENVSGYQSTIVFDVDDNAKVYLERELGLQQANKLMSSELNIWFWEVRFFRPQQEEEFRVRVSPAGQIAGYDHKIEESRAGASLDRATAQSATQSYLGAKLGLHLGGWDFLPEEANSSKRPNRLDWAFTWEKHGFRAKDAPYRLQVTLQGDKVGGSEEFLKVPEAWERSYQQLRSSNIFYNQIAVIPYILFLGSGLWVGITLTKHGQTSWGGAIKLGVVVAALFFLMELNQWQFERAGYDTHESYSSFVLFRLGIALASALGTALMVTLVLPGGEALYRSYRPDRMQLSKAFTLRGLRSKEFFSSAVVGLTLAAAHIGFIVAFYMVGSRYGVWAPQDLNYSDTVNTTFPWIAGVAIGLMASTSEEFLFRLFAIPFVEQMTKSRVLAVVLPAFSWSFLHSAYPQEPGYIRGIEVGIIGVVAGIVMLRWGIVATLIWHYTVDASLVGLLLIRSNSLYFKISGVVVGAAAVAPLVFACISYLTSGGFETAEDLLNRAAPVPESVLTGEREPATSEVKPGHYTALAPGMIAFLAVCLLGGGLVAWRLKPQSIGEYLKLSVNARTARARADQVMRQRGSDPNSYYHAAVFVDIADPVVNEYLRQRVGIAGVNAIYAERVPAALWRVRYFRDSQPEEFAVVLRPDGSLHSVRHTLAEEAPGASLTKEEAVSRAEKFLRDEKKLDLKDWALVESNSDKRPHRIDHMLTWQQNEPLDAAASLSASSSASTGDHAHARMDVQVLGDEVTNYRTYIKIPDDWRRKQEELSLFRAVFSYVIPILYFTGLGLTALIVFLKNLKSEAARSIPWRRIALWSIWGLFGYLAVFFLGNRVPSFLNAYNTAIPLKVMYGGLAIGALLGGPLYFGAVALLFAIAWYYANRAFGEDYLPGWAGRPGSYYRDALWIGLGGVAGLLGLERLLAVASTYWPTVHRSLEASFGLDFDALLPAASIVGGTVLRGLLFTGLVAATAALVAAQVRQTALRVLLLLFGSLALAGGNWGSPADLAKQFLARLILLSVLILGVRWVMRFNILGCFLVVAATILLGGATELLSQPDSFYRANGYAVLLALILLFGWPFAGWRMSDSSAIAGASDTVH
ncbi:MAG TPA: CPBP family intramembrane glutamic endopeptidase [Candidatus Polarisedimenticolia bacterium]|nr:CPBP family intramembrane glutamic endopeptidase [Candidatus Polarisedimenticolia bacterium]